MKKVLLLVIGLLIFQPIAFAMSDIETVKFDYEQYGFKVKKINVIYVKNFYGNTNVKAVYNDGTITMINDEIAVRVARHEVAHAVSLDLIKLNQDGFNKYKTDRISDVKIKTKFYNLTGDEFGYVLKLLRWYYKSTQVEEIVAEDICHMIFGYDVLTKDYIGNPTTKELEQLKSLLGIE